MKIFETKIDLINYLNENRTGKKVGFIPTMGALHDGHLELIRRAKTECQLVVASIFVNPTQFNNPQDLKNYPRTLEADKTRLEKVQTDILFCPSVEEIYPPGEIPEVYDFGYLEQVMEGKFRPGHFKGVAGVVERLFRLVNPDQAYFGEKDFQQLTIIRELIKKMKARYRIIGCPTVREQDGLAMSSRNALLTQEERKAAPAIARALFFIRDNYPDYSVQSIKNKAITMIEEEKMIKVEYLEIADELLHPVTEWKSDLPVRAFTAAKLGNVRLIDNVAIPLS